MRRRRSTCPSTATCRTACSAPTGAGPRQYLDHRVRANNSGTALADPATTAVGIARLEADLESGAWHERHADLSELESIDMGYRLLVAG